ncbi:MAG: hypothetical protein GX095_03775 [Clostridiales bacterium]|jgi:uncharacterized spore protein YtfJ|nr:hypothetical protein [Clostridiales bacterium]
MINGLNEMLGDIMGRLKTLIDVDSVIGKPIVSGPATVLPVSKLCFGFVTGGTDKKDLSQGKENSLPDTMALIGGGITITPLGFLIVEDKDIYFIKAQGDNVNKWLDIVQSTIKNISK